MRATHRGDRVDRHISSVGAQEFIHVSPDGQAVRFLGGAGDTQPSQRHSETWERCCWSQEVRRQKVAIEVIDSCPGCESDEDPRALPLVRSLLGLGRALSTRPVQLDVVAGEGESMIGGDVTSPLLDGGVSLDFHGCPALAAHQVMMVGGGAAAVRHLTLGGADGVELAVIDHGLQIAVDGGQADGDVPVAQCVEHLLGSHE